MAKGDSSSSGAAVNNANNMMQSSNSSMSSLAPSRGMPNAQQQANWNMWTGPNSGAAMFKDPNSNAANLPTDQGPYSWGGWGNPTLNNGMPNTMNPRFGQTNTMPNEQAMRMPMNSQQQMSNTNPMPSVAPTDMNALIQQFLMRLNGNNQPNASFVPGQGIR